MLFFTFVNGSKRETKNTQEAKTMK